MAVNVKSYKRRSSKGKVYTVRAYSRGGNKKVNLDGMEINRKAPTMSDEEFDRLQAKQDQEMREFIQNLQGVAKAYGVKGGTEKLIQPRSKNPIAKAKADTKSETARIMKEIRCPVSHRSTHRARVVFSVNSKRCGTKNSPKPLRSTAHTTSFSVRGYLRETRNRNGRSKWINLSHVSWMYSPWGTCSAS